VQFAFGFYKEFRIICLIKEFFYVGYLLLTVLSRAESLYKKIEELFANVLFALLHSDLWSENFMITSSIDISIFDPAVHFGHR